jgi:hypothetical protein
MSIEIYQKQTVMPVVAEKLGTPTILDNGDTAPVLERLETAHARRLDIHIKQSAAGGISSVSIRSYTAGRLWYHQYQVQGGIAPTTYCIVVGEPYSNGTQEFAIGDTIDVVVANGIDNNTIHVWAIARS